MNQSPCELAGTCSGCPWIEVPIENQIAKKTYSLRKALESEGLSGHWQNIKIDSAGTDRLRNRVDLTWSNGKLGLFDSSRQNILDLQECPQMTEPLENFLKRFRQNPPPLLGKGSVRLRVGPRPNASFINDPCGAWLDFSHQDTKSLLEEQDWLKWLSGFAHIEMGQRFKPIILNSEGRLKLQSQIAPKAWFSTFVTTPAKDLMPIDLYGTVGSFTQPSIQANKVLIKTLLEILTEFVEESSKEFGALELFSGLGNLTIPLASLGYQVTAYELSEVAVNCFKTTIDHYPVLKNNISLAQKDLYRESELFSATENPKLVLVDPPRSGLKFVLQKLSELSLAKRPKYFVYVSCFAESLAKDLKALLDLGYKILTIRGVDQFPHTPHCEWIALVYKD